MENGEIRIRLARRSDFEDMHSIYCAYSLSSPAVLEFNSPEYIEFSLRLHRAMKKYPCLAAEEDGRVIGFSLAEPFDAPYIFSHSAKTCIYLDQRYQRRGIGRRLHAAMEEMLKAMGICNLYACIGRYNETSSRRATQGIFDFYSRMGYRTAGEFECCVFHSFWYDMAWMEKHIGEHADLPVSLNWFPRVRNRFARYDIPFPKDAALARALCDEAEDSFKAAQSGNSSYYEEVYHDCIWSAINPWRTAALMGYDAGLEGIEQDDGETGFNIDFLLQCLENGSDYATKFMGRHIFQSGHSRLSKDFNRLLAEEDPAAMCAQGLWLLHGDDRYPGRYHPEKINISTEQAEEGLHLLDRAAKGGSMRAKCEAAILAFDQSRQRDSSRRRQAERDILECLRAGYPYAFRALAETKLYDCKDSIYNWEPLRDILQDPSICDCTEYSFLENLYQHLYSSGEPEFEQEDADAVMDAVKQIIEINRGK